MSAPQQLSGFNNQIPPRYAIKSITAAYTVSGADYGLTLNFQGAGNVVFTLPPAAVVGAGFNCWIWNQPSSIGVITLTPTGGSTIDSIANIIVPSGQGTQIVSDGLNWQTGAKKHMRLFSESASGFTKPQATGTNAVVIGTGSFASGTNSYAIGSLAAAAGNASYAMGNGATAAQVNSYAFGSSGSSNVVAKMVFGSPGLAGSAQWGVLPLVASTTTATATVLSSDLGAASATNQIVLVPTSAIAFLIYVVGRQSTALGSATAAWKIEGLIRQEATASTTTLVGTPTVTAISNVPAWAVAVSANTTLGCLTVTVTGAATSIQWLATAYTSEIIMA